ncbi:MAG: tRNA 2-thiocytidine biosynthesis TtcA family protein [Fibrobacteraceae bacterium]
MASYIKRRVNKKITKALHDFPLIEEGDRVLVGASGGKDSTALLLELAGRQGKAGPNFDLAAIHIQSDFADKAPREFLKSLETKLSIPFYYLDIAVEGRLKPGFKLNCYWCSTQRRLELLEFAKTNGYNKIALGHHLDDIIETLLMNMLYEGEFSGMPPIVPYEKYPISIVRPLCYCENSELREYIKEAGLSQYTCTCDFSKNSKRKSVRAEIEKLTEGNSTLKRNLFESMRHIKMDYLL